MQSSQMQRRTNISFKSVPISVVAQAQLCLLLSSLFVGRLHADAPDAQGIEFFEKRIRPVLVEHCYECHSDGASESNRLKGGLRLDSDIGFKTGGDSGSLIPLEGEATGLLVKALRHEDVQMPPSGKLADSVIADFEAWVKMGLPMPSADGKVVARKEVDWSEARKAWAFNAPVEHPTPMVGNTVWPRTKLDCFVLFSMEQRGLKPSVEASKRELIRRATLDLIGLPPTPQEVDAFLLDESPEAFAIVVDRLLQSTHYGERWARYWIDLARYADDQGNSFLSPAPTAYLYRDWVINAFNRDMPYDEFVRLQLAGDEVPGEANDYVERLAGLGFQGLGPQFRKGAAGEEKAKADELEDRLDTLSRAFLGLTVSCARCHDHKFDPIPTRDYYSMAAAYNGAAWPERMLASPSAIEKLRAWEQQVQQQKAELESWTQEQAKTASRMELDKIDQYIFALADLQGSLPSEPKQDEANVAKKFGLKLGIFSKWIPFIAAAKQGEPAFELRQQLDGIKQISVVAEAEQRLKELASRYKEEVGMAIRKHEQPTDSEEISERESMLLKSLWQNEPGPFFVVAKEALTLLDEKQSAEHMSRQKALAELSNSAPPKGPTMPSVSGGGDALRVFVRGNPLQLGEPAPPGFLRILSPDSSNASTAIPPNKFTRFELANSIASRDNPLTARVIVNRLWHYHFGRGIVSSLGNFGKNGTPPTHPELLDTLAVRFMNNGWSIKSLHREIMLSSTYRQSSSLTPENYATDPDNHYLWRMSPRRLDFEAWRDTVLCVAGKLDPSLGGPSLDQKTPAVKEVPSLDVFTRLVGRDIDDPQNTRRTIYSIVSRYAPHPTASLFDFPEPNVASDLRNVTTIPQQQLFVLNSPFMLEMGRSLASRVKAASESDEGRLQVAWELAYNRSPNQAELAAASEFLKAGVGDENAAGLDRWEQLCHSLLASNEFAFLP